MHIFIAEDDTDMQKILKLYLQKDGYVVSVVSNGKEAIAFLSEHVVDLVLLDWMMPIQDGIQTCRDIRQLHIPTKILMLTAKGENEDEVQGLSCENHLIYKYCCCVFENYVKQKIFYYIRISF